MIIGVTMGLLAGYYRGALDTLLTRAMDVLLAFPVLVLAIGIGVACSGKDGCAGGLIQPGLPVVIFVITLAGWPYMARIIRGQVLSLREKEFVEAARSLGASDRRIIFREILPNLVAPIIVYTTMLIPHEHPVRGGALVPGRRASSRRTASWGAMIADATSHLRHGLVVHDVPGHRAPAHRPRLQPGRRRAAGRAEPADIEVGTCTCRTFRTNAVHSVPEKKEVCMTRSTLRPLLASVVAALALVVAACGGSDSSGVAAARAPREEEARPARRPAASRVAS